MQIQSKSPFLSLYLIVFLLTACLQESPQNQAQLKEESKIQIPTDDYVDGTYFGESHEVTVRSLKWPESYSIEMNLFTSSESPQQLNLFGILRDGLIVARQNKCVFVIEKISTFELKLMQKSQELCTTPVTGKSISLEGLYKFKTAITIFEDGTYGNEIQKIRIEKLKNGNEYWVEIFKTHPAEGELPYGFLAYRIENTLEVNQYSCKFNLVQEKSRMFNFHLEDDPKCIVDLSNYKNTGNYELRGGRLGRDFMRALRDLSEYTKGRF